MKLTIRVTITTHPLVVFINVMDKQSLTRNTLTVFTDVIGKVTRPHVCTTVIEHDETTSHVWFRPEVL